MKAIKRSLVGLLAIPLLLAACSTPAPTDAPTSAPTDTPPNVVIVGGEPATYTVVPTYTSPATYTPVPTYTPPPTFTPEPTFTPLIPGWRPTRTPIRRATQTPRQTSTPAPTRTPRQTSTRVSARTPTRTSAPTSTRRATPASSVEISDLEQEMLEAINDARAENGLDALDINPVLAELARGHAQDMVERGYRDHVTPEGKTYADRVKESGLETDRWGENWYGDNCARSEIVACAMEWIMGDPPHRANVLHDRYTRVGIGIVETGQGGYLIVQDFAALR